RMVGAVKVPTENAAMQSSADRMLDDTVAVHEDFVSGAMDSIRVFGVSVVKGEVLPASGCAGPWQSDPIDNCKIDQRAAPDDTVAIDIVSVGRQLWHSWPTRGQQTSA